MEDEDPKYCKLCLVTDVKMYSLNTPSTVETYSQLLQVVIICENYQMYVCYECVSLLQKYQEFRLKCLTAINVLSSINMDHSKISKDIVKKIDRKRFNLESKLSCSTLLRIKFNEQKELQKDCNKIDLTLSDDDVDSNVKIETDVPKIKLKIDADPKNIKQYDDTDFSMEIVLIPHDFEQSNSCDSEIKIKRKCSPKLKKNEDIKFSTEELVQNVNKSDKPAKVKGSITRTRRKDNSLNKGTVKQMKYTKKSIEYIENLFKDYGTVVYMSKEEAMNEVLSRKESSNYKSNPFKCELCYKGFNVETTYDNHMKRHSLERGSWECEYCHIRVTTKTHLNIHIMSCHKRKYTCSKCPYVCNSINQANAHMNRHKGKKFECKECGQCFIMPNSLSSHKRHKHPTEIVCPLCGNLFGSLQGLNAHQKLLHRQDSTELLGPKCEECDVQFTTETAWKRHLVLSSKHFVSNGCEHCGQTFDSSEALRKHKKQHPRMKNKRRYDFTPPAPCTICKEWLTGLTEYKTHMKSQHPSSEVAKVIVKKAEEQTQFICEMCGAVFKCDKWLSTRHVYREHMKSEHPSSDIAKRIKQKEALELVCEVCGMVYKKRWLLLEHQLKHTGEYPFECSDCGKKFRQRSTLCQHKHTHTRTRVFECDLCQRQYRTKPALVRHIKKCSVCGKKLRQRSTLCQHKHTHTRTRVFECYLCQRQYRTKPALARHIKKGHFGIRPHECSYCHKRFQFNCEVRMHIEYVHHSKPWPKRDRTTRNAKGQKSVLQ